MKTDYNDTMLNAKHREYGKTKEISINTLQKGFASLAYVQVALLFGSRALGTATEKSDYDFALVLEEDEHEIWGVESKAWADIHELFGLDDCDYDVVNMKRMSQAMKESIQNSYVILKGDSSDISKLLR